MRFVALVFAVVSLIACGIKAPPRPPLEAAQVDERPDGGCCGARP